MLQQREPEFVHCLSYKASADLRILFLNCYQPKGGYGCGQTRWLSRTAALAIPTSTAAWMIWAIRLKPWPRASHSLVLPAQRLSRAERQFYFSKFIILKSALISAECGLKVKLILSPQTFDNADKFL